MRIVLTGFLTFSLLSGAALAPVLNSPAFAQNAASGPMINVRVGEHPDFDRIVFDWPRNVKYSISREGDRVTVVFADTGQARAGADVARLGRIKGFTSGTDASGHLTVSFTVGAGAALKDFTSEKSVVIDVKNAPAKEAAKAAPKAETKPETKTVETKQKEEPAKTAPAPLASPPVATKSDKTTKPAEAAATEPPLPLTPKPEAAAETVSPPVLPPTASTEAAAPTPAPEQKAITASSLPSPSTKTGGISTAELGDTPLLVATLDPRTPTRAAIFARGGDGYIIFDRKLTLGIDALTAGQQAPRVQLEPLDLPKASGFRFVMPSTASLRATREGNAWQIYLAKEDPDVPVSTSLVAQPDFALGARFLLPLPDAPEPVRMTDPIVGDTVIVVPLAQNQAFSVARRMADFEIVPAAQGLMIRPMTDKIVARAVSDGVEITTEGGLRLSTANDTGASQQSTQKAKSAAAGKSLFDFTAWRGKPEESFTQTRQRLQQTIVDVPEAERNRARLELARFYFAHGNGEEAVAMLKYLAKQVPDLMAHADFLALLGASEILAYHPEAGLKHLDTPLLKDQPEIELWQAVAEAQLRSWKEAEEKFAITETQLGGYPEPFYSRFSVLAIESALAADKDHEAADWIDRLENGPHEPSIAPALAYLHGVLHAKSGRAVAAEQDWKNAANGFDRLYKVRAELALIDLGVSTGSLTPAQAADRLEALRFGWRGDDLEVDILHRLGQFYIQAKNVKTGLSVLSRAVQLYPDSPMTPQIQAEMSGIFHDVFLSDLGKNLSPLDALTIYQQYRNLMPKGSEGIAVTRNLAERLVAIDLLDQASGLLEDLVKNKLSGEDKARTGARLAGIRLLDHKPEAALTALDYDAGAQLPLDLANERQLLRAKALADMKRTDEALALIESSPKDSAKILKADIAMHAQKWEVAAKTLLELVGAPPKPGVNLKPNQIDWLINCAIALSMDNDQTGLDKLAIDYGAAMAGTPESDTFRILTQPEHAGQLKDIAGAQSRISDVDMFQGFLNSYRKADDAGKDAKESKP